MAITFDILGEPGCDNALLVRVDSGQGVDRLLFDCGEACLSRISFSEIQAIDALCFSHFHIDHVAGFDSFFRCNFDRSAKPNIIIGPPGASRLLQHRFQGFLWNLHQSMNGTWHIAEIHPNGVVVRRYELSEAFAVEHAEPTKLDVNELIEPRAFTIDSITMDHNTPSVAYIVRERIRQNFDVSLLPKLGLRPGPWMKQIKDGPADLEFVEINGVRHSVSELRGVLVTTTPGDSIAYLTDFLMDETAIQRLTPILSGCKTVICESQYRNDDIELACRNYHMTGNQAAELAKRAGVGELVLFHLSVRYTREEWLEILKEAQSIFPRTRFPAEWHSLNQA